MSNKIWRQYNAGGLLDIHIWPENWAWNAIQENRYRPFMPYFILLKLGALLRKPSFFLGLVYSTTLEWKIMPP
jgi:hypothetical protein